VHRAFQRGVGRLGLGERWSWLFERAWGAILILVLTIDLIFRLRHRLSLIKRFDLFFLLVVSRKSSFVHKTNQAFPSDPKLHMYTFSLGCPMA